MAKKKKSNVYRFFSKATGEHYVVRLSREAYDNLKEKKVKKFSKKLKKHVDFEVKKLSK